MIATTEQYAAMLDAASAGGYALPAVNVTSSETLNGAMRGFAEAGADGIVQVTTGAAEFLSGSVRDMSLGARALAEYARALGERYPVLIALHTDHAPPEKFDALVRPLIDEARRRRRRGEQPLFHSHMFDGSTLPLAENLRVSARLLEELAALGVVLEVESGVVGGEEDGIAGPRAGRAELYTTTEDLIRVVDALGAGERGRYLLAATFGNVHGVHPPGHVDLRPAVLRDGQAALDERRPGARFQYVFHGSSGSPPEQVREAIASGVVKVNLDTDAQYAFTRAIADHVFTNYDGVLKIDGHVGRKAAYDPRSWGRADATVAAARALWARIDRPNAMIKIPATVAGVEATRRMTADGINVNVTLLFSVARYDAVIDAFLAGLEERLHRRQAVAHVASVASFFVSRVDTAVDRLLAARGREELAGRAAVANARLAYAHAVDAFAGARFAALRAAGARPQRPLWASTGTKNPRYSDVKYVDELAGPGVVNTMPPATLAAVRNHGRPRDRLTGTRGDAHATLERLTAAGIDLDALTDRLLSDGVLAAFAASMDELLAGFTDTSNTEGRAA